MAPSLKEYEDVADLQPVEIQRTKAGNKDAAFSVLPEESEKLDLVVRVFRCLIADLCEQFNGGHPGSVQDIR